MGRSVKTVTGSSSAQAANLLHRPGQPAAQIQGALVSEAGHQFAGACVERLQFIVDGHEQSGLLPVILLLKYENTLYSNSTARDKTMGLSYFLSVYL